LSQAFLSLGSNIGDREAQLRDAMRRLEESGVHIVRRSSIHETEPEDVLDQPRFLNMAIEIETELSAEELLQTIHKIEADLGRERTIPKGPRTIDIDILLYADTVFETPQLEIPHPRMAQRRFVLEPLAEIASDVRDPVTGKTVREMLADLSE